MKLAVPKDSLSRYLQIPLSFAIIVMIERELSRGDFVAFLAISGLWSSFSFFTDMGISMTVSRASTGARSVGKATQNGMALRLLLSLLLGLGVLGYLRVLGLQESITVFFWLAMIAQTGAHYLMVIARSLGRLQLELRTGLLSRLTSLIGISLVSFTVAEGSPSRAWLIGLALVLGETAGFLHMIYCIPWDRKFGTHHGREIRFRSVLLTREAVETAVVTLTSALAFRLEGLFVPTLLDSDSVANYFIFLRVYEVAAVPVILDSSRRHAEFVDHRWTLPRSKIILLSPLLLSLPLLACMVVLSNLGWANFLVVEGDTFDILLLIVSVSLWFLLAALSSHRLYGLTLQSPRAMVLPQALVLILKASVFAVVLSLGISFFLAGVILLNLFASMVTLVIPSRRSS